MHCPSINQLIIQSPWKSEWRSVCLSHSVSGLVRHSVIQSLFLVILTHISEIDLYWTSRSTKMVLAIAKSKLLEGNCHPKDRFRSEFVYSRLVFSMGDVQVFNGEVSKHISSLLQVHKMHCIYVLFHWPRHSKAIIIEKVIPCFRKFHPWKKQKQKQKKQRQKKHWSSQSKKKKSPTGPAYLKHQLLCNHRQKSFRRRADIYLPKTYIFYNTYKSIRSRQLHFVTHLE